MQMALVNWSRAPFKAHPILPRNYLVIIVTTDNLVSVVNIIVVNIIVIIVITGVIFYPTFC